MKFDDSPSSCAPARFQVSSPDHEVEPAFQDGIARGPVNSSKARCAKEAVSFCSRMSFGSSVCQLVVVNAEAAVFLLIDSPFLDRNNVLPRGHARGNAGRKPC